MSLPRINIAYQNGKLGTVPDGEDGLLVLCAKGAAVSGTLETGKPYKIYRLAGLEALGVTADTHGSLYAAVQQFYTEAEEGTPLIVVVYSDTTMAAFCDKDSGSLKGILQSLNGSARGVVVLHPDVESPTVTEAISADVYNALTKAQALANWTATELYAPIFVILDGYAYDSDDLEDLRDLGDGSDNRVGIMIGSVSATEKHAAVGLLAGRIAESPVQRNIGRVKDGAVAASELYVGSKKVENAMDDIASIYEMRYITPRTHVGLGGYFFTDDILCTKETDDYAHLTARRTIDKVVRIAYGVLLNNLLDEIEINDDGTMQEPVLKAWQADVESAVNAAMTASGELVSVDGSGVECFIDPKQNVRSTSLIRVQVAARPFGYARTINAEFGFKVE